MLVYADAGVGVVGLHVQTRPLMVLVLVMK